MSKKNTWLQFTEEGVSEFTGKILPVLVKFYDAVSEKPNQSNDFRRELCKAKNVEIYCKKYGKYEYLIFAQNNDNQTSDSWIHIDGIEQERDDLKKMGKSEHPVFEMVNLFDVVSNHSKSVKKNPID